MDAIDMMKNELKESLPLPSDATAGDDSIKEPIKLGDDSNLLLVTTTTAGDQPDSLRVKAGERDDAADAAPASSVADTDLGKVGLKLKAVSAFGSGRDDNRLLVGDAAPAATTDYLVSSSLDKYTTGGGSSSSKASALGEAKDNKDQTIDRLGEELAKAKGELAAYTSFQSEWELDRQADGKVNQVIEAYEKLCVEQKSTLHEKQQLEEELSTLWQEVEKYATKQCAWEDEKKVMDADKVSLKARLDAATAVSLDGGEDDMLRLTEERFRAEEARVGAQLEVLRKEKDEAVEGQQASKEAARGATAQAERAMAEKERAHAEVQGMRQDLERFAAMRQSWSDEKTSMEKNVKSAEAKLKAQDGDAKQAVAQAAALKDEIAAMKKWKQDQTRASAKSSRADDSLVQDKERAETEVKTLRQDLERFAAMRQSWSEEKASMERQVRVLEESSVRQAQSATSSSTDMSAKVRLARDQALAEGSVERNRLERQIAAQQQQMEEQRRQQTTWEQERRSHSNDLDAVRQAQDTMRAKEGAALDDAAEARSRLEVLESKERAWNEERRGYEERLRQMWSLTTGADRASVQGRGGAPAVPEANGFNAYGSAQSQPQLSPRHARPHQHQSPPPPSSPRPNGINVYGQGSSHYMNGPSSAGAVASPGAPAGFGSPGVTPGSATVAVPSSSPGGADLMRLQQELMATKSERDQLKNKLEIPLRRRSVFGHELQMANVEAEYAQREEEHTLARLREEVDEFESPSAFLDNFFASLTDGGPPPALTPQDVSYSRSRL